MHFTILPPHTDRRITASVGFAFIWGQPDRMVIVQNKRGWDIPGGHLEGTETPLDAFIRELQEEAASKLLPGAKPIALLESRRDRTTGILVYQGICMPGAFVPGKEILARALVSPQAFLELYFGDKSQMEQIVDLLTWNASA